MFLNEMFGRRAAPEINPGDQVITPRGSAIVLDARQNRDGHYVWFTVEHMWGELDGEQEEFHIRELKPIQDHGEAANYLDHAPDRAGGNIDTEA
jgi:hypothetical protein